MITIDFETRSHANLPEVGEWVYSQHPTTEVICACYGIDDEEIQAWWPGKKLTGVQAWPEEESYTRPDCPYDLYKALEKGHVVEAHNLAFEKSIWMNVLQPRYNWLLPSDSAWRDSMAVAAYYAMPQGLEKLATALNFSGKNSEGIRLISKYSKLYLKSAKEEIPEEDFLKFVEYCKRDVELEKKVSHELGDLPQSELEVFHLDQEINLRGIWLDKKSINDALAIVNQRAAELKNEFKEITGLNPSQTLEIKKWFHGHGCLLDNLQAEYIEELLEGRHFPVTSDTVRKALDIRNRYNKASTKKLKAMLRQRSSDGRARFQTRYHGCSTGRWKGSGFQPLNMSKGFGEKVHPEVLIRDIAHRNAEWLDCVYGDAMKAVGNSTRHHVKAPEGHRFIVGDFVSIEAVLLSCLANEEWKIEAFTNGHPIYELMGCSIHNLPEEVIDLAWRDKAAFKKAYPAERSDGKTGELAFGYQGAVGAWRKFDRSDRHSEEKINEIKNIWRARHPAIEAFWEALEKAAIRAIAGNVETKVQTEFMPEDHNCIRFKPIDEWLACRLPNGKHIWYRDPELRLDMPVWHKPTLKKECAEGTCKCEPVKKLSYMSMKEGRWMRVTTYGGKLAENVTQAVAREVLVQAKLRLRDAGYKIILSIYDEIVTEMPEGTGSMEQFVSIMSESPGKWAENWPIKVDAWEGRRYRK